MRKLSLEPHPKSLSKREGLENPVQLTPSPLERVGLRLKTASTHKPENFGNPGFFAQ